MKPSKAVYTPTASDIRAAVTETEPRFFSRENLRLMGDTMRNFGTYRRPDGAVILYRRKAVKHGVRGQWVYDEIARTLHVVIGS